MAAGKVFGHLMLTYEPLPYLGDMMFNTLLRPLIEAPQPLIHEQPGSEWPRRLVRLTALGERVVRGELNWLDLGPAERWVGGVQIVADRSPWVVSAEGRVWRR